MADYAATTWVEKVTKVGPTRLNPLEQAVADASTHHKRGTWAAIPAANAASKNWTYWCTDRGVMYVNFDGANWTRTVGDMALGAISEYGHHLTGNPPPGCVPCDGRLLDRVVYADLFALLVSAPANGQVTNGSNQITGSTTNPPVGHYIEGLGIPFGARVQSTVFAGGFYTITMSVNATAAAPVNPTPIRYSRWGFGDGATYFNVPLLNDVGCKLWWNTAGRSWAATGGLPWDVEQYDPANLHDPAVPSDMLAPVSGKYEINLQIATTATMPASFSAEVYSTLQRDRGGTLYNIADSNVVPSGSTCRISETLDLQGGDKIRVLTTNASGTPVTVASGFERTTHIEFHLLGAIGPAPKCIKVF